MPNRADRPPLALYSSRIAAGLFFLIAAGLGAAPQLTLLAGGLGNVQHLGTASGEAVFASSTEDGWIIWASRGEPATTRPILETPAFCSHHDCSGPPRFLPVGDDWFFVAGDQFEGFDQVWRVDPSGMAPARALFEPDRLSEFGAVEDVVVASRNDFLLIAQDAQSGVRSIQVLDGDSGELTPLSGSGATGGSLGVVGRLWILSDASRLLPLDLDSRRARPPISLGFASISRQNLLERENGVAFLRDLGPDSAIASELWVSDGTASGTRRVGQWDREISASRLQAPEYASFDLLLIEPSGGPDEIWMSDGTVRRTRRLASLPPGRFHDRGYWTRFRGAAYWTLLSGDAEVASLDRLEIWTSDGSSAGTARIVALPIPPGFSNGPELAAVADRLFFIGSDAEHGQEIWASDGTESGTHLFADVEPGAEGSTPFHLNRLGDRIFWSARTTAEGRELWRASASPGSAAIAVSFRPGEESAESRWVGTLDEVGLIDIEVAMFEHEVWSIGELESDPCTESSLTLCLLDGRFRAAASWRDADGRLGVAHPVSLTGDSGYFWFFDPAIPELLTRIVDACAMAPFGNFWSFTTGLTDLEVDAEVVDTWGGGRKSIQNRLGRAFETALDTGGFHSCTASPPAQARSQISRAADAAPWSVAGNCVTEGALCLLDGRFEISAVRRSPGGEEIAAEPVLVSESAGYFWFFEADAVELLIKVIDACGEPDFGSYWIFAAGLTDLEVRLSVRDSLTGETLLFANPPGTPFSPILETAAFRSCP